MAHVCNRSTSEKEARESGVLWSKARKRLAGKPTVKFARSCGFLKVIKYLLDNRFLCQTLYLMYNMGGIPTYRTIKAVWKAMELRLRRVNAFTLQS